MVRYKNRHLRPSRPVEVYRNLSIIPGAVVYSIRQDGKVIGHDANITLSDCEFVVQEAGRKRVIETGHKNVHAYVRGSIVRAKKLSVNRWYSGRYNPTKGSTFVGEYEGPLFVAPLVHLNSKGLSYAFTWRIVP